MLSRWRPTDVEAHNNLAFILLAQKKLAEAAAAFERVLQINPRFAEAHNNLGNVLKELGRPADAAVSFQRRCRSIPSIPMRITISATSCNNRASSMWRSNIFAVPSPWTPTMPPRTVTWG